MPREQKLCLTSSCCRLFPQITSRQRARNADSQYGNTEPIGHRLLAEGFGDDFLFHEQNDGIPHRSRVRCDETAPDSLHCSQSQCYRFERALLLFRMRREHSRRDIQHCSCSSLPSGLWVALSLLDVRRVRHDPRSGDHSRPAVSPVCVSLWCDPRFTKDPAIGKSMLVRNFTLLFACALFMYFLPASVPLLVVHHA